MQVLASEADNMIIADAEACSVTVRSNGGRGKLWTALQLLQHLTEPLQVHCHAHFARL